MRAAAFANNGDSVPLVAVLAGWQHFLLETAHTTAVETPCPFGNLLLPTYLGKPPCGPLELKVLASRCGRRLLMILLPSSPPAAQLPRCYHCTVYLCLHWLLHTTCAVPGAALRRPLASPAAAAIQRHSHLKTVLDLT